MSDLFGRGMVYVFLWSLQIVLATVVSPILAHTIAPFEFGRISAAIALYQLLMLVGVLGLDQALEMRRVEEKTPGAPLSRGLLASAIIIAWTATGLAAATSSLWAPVLGFPPGDPLVVIVLVWTLPASAVLMMLALLQAEDRLTAFTWVSVFSTAGTLAFGLILLFTVGRTAVIYTFGNIIGQGIAFAIGLLATRPRWRGAWQQPAVLRSALALGLPLTITGLSQFILTAADRFLIQRWLGSVEVARYQVAFVVGNVMSLLLMWTNKAWLPRLKAIRDTAQRWAAVVRARDGIYELLAWALLGITVSAPVLLRVVAPESYHLEPLVMVVFVVALGALPLTSIASSVQILITESTSRPLIVGGLAAVVIKVIVTVFGLGWLGLVGAALGTTLAVLGQAVVLRWIVSLRHPGGHDSWRTMGLLLVTMAIAAVSTQLPQTGIWFWGRFVFSVLCLLPFVLAWRRLQSDDSLSERDI